MQEFASCLASRFRRCLLGLTDVVTRSPSRIDVMEKEGQPFWLFAAEEPPSMCDYSLHHVASRAAKIEDKLIVTKFNNSITRGFAAVGEPHVAVCLLPGTEIAFEENVECEPSFGIGILPNKKIGQRLARFRQINMDNAVTHHDALEFPDGQVILLTRLCDGQRATVLQLPAAPRTAEEAGEQRRVSVVV
jgi:hypothetical protein